jgi:hypothetical protein
MLKLEHRVSVFVPSTVQTDQNALETQRAQVDRVAREFSLLYGGATSEAVTGYWMSDTVGLVKETPVRVWAFCQTIDTEKLIALAEVLKSEMSQEAILCEIDGAGILV